MSKGTVAMLQEVFDNLTDEQRERLKEFDIEIKTKDEIEELQQRQKMEELFNSHRLEMPPELPPLYVDPLPHVKGGRYHAEPRDLQKQKKAKRKQQKAGRKASRKRKH